MFTNFHNVSFIRSEVIGLEVEGTTLLIETSKKTFEVSFASEEEAKAGLQELTSVLNGSTDSTKKPSASKTDKVLQDTIQSLQSLRDKATKHIADAAFDTIIKGRTSDIKDDLLSFAQNLPNILDMFNTPKDEVEEPVKPTPKAMKPKAEVEETVKPNQQAVKPTTCFNDILSGIFTAPTETVDIKVTSGLPKTMTLDEFKLVFGTDKEPVIGDLRHDQIKEFVSDFVDGVLENERVQTLFSSIKKQFSEEDALKAVEGYKDLIYTVSIQNIEMTLSAIIQNFFS